MAQPPPNLAQNAFNSYKFKDNYPPQAKGISFSAFLLSMFIYISIFYIFNLSPSTLLNNTKFWFFISNTLILIIAADYGAFSSSLSSKQKQDFSYEDYVIHSRARGSAYSSFPSQNQEVVRENSEEIIKHVVVEKSEVPAENKLEIVIKSDKEEPSDKIVHEMKAEFAPDGHIDADHNKKEEPSDKIVHEMKPEFAPDGHIDADHNKKKIEETIGEVNEETKIIVHNSENQMSESSIEENEFSTMSDEELNRRVEEFIQKFNRQIRLQRTRNLSQF